MILFITNKEDITTDFIINKLNNFSIPYYRLNTEDLFSESFVCLDITNNNYSIFDKSKNIIVDLNEIKSVYYRRPLLPTILSFSLSKGEKDFLLREFQATLDGLCGILEEKYWISRISSIKRAENKVLQLLCARKQGFIIPNSLITNDVKKAQNFIRENGNDCIIKPLKNGFIDDKKNSRVIFTSEIKLSDINKIKDIKDSSIYLQRRIEKKADIRVTVVGEQIFATKILSQVSEKTKTDWRRGNALDLIYENIKLPDGIASLCIEYVRSLGLQFGAIDMTIDGNNNFIFLEINPNGQWAWIENRVGYDISGEIIKLLLNNGSGKYVNIQY